VVSLNTVKGCLEEPVLKFIFVGVIVFLLDSPVNNNDILDENQMRITIYLDLLLCSLPQAVACCARV
jgi:hypothetical protein